MSRSERPSQAATGGRRWFLRRSGGAAIGATAAALGVGSRAEASASGFGQNLVDDYGAVGDGVTDDTAAVQSALRSLDGSTGTPQGGVTGGWLWVPPGDYVVSDTIQLHRFAGVIQGAGVGNLPTYTAPASAGAAAAFRWVGPAGRPMFRVTDSRNVTFRNLMFVGRDGSAPSSGIDFHAIENAGNGSNGELVVEDCLFGAYPWTAQGTNVGHLEVGVSFSGVDANNDQFRLNRCQFVAPGSVLGMQGIVIDNPQSIWGSITDCTFDRLTLGVDTAASVMLTNPQFNRCGLDLSVRSTARMQILGLRSEHAVRLGKVAPEATLQVHGGTCQLDPKTMPTGSGTMINAFPSGSGQSVVLRDVTFFEMGRPADSMPTIAFGPDRGTQNAAGAPGFYLRIDNCTGLRSQQADFVGEMWASRPQSRGLVEWVSRSTDGVDQFRNEMRAEPGLGARATLDRQAWDPPRS